MVSSAQGERGDSYGADGKAEPVPFVDPLPEDSGGEQHSDGRVERGEYGGDTELLARWLGDHEAPIRCVDDQPGPRRLAVATSNGQVVINVTGAI